MPGRRTAPGTYKRVQAQAAESLRSAASRTHSCLCPPARQSAAWHGLALQPLHLLPSAPAARWEQSSQLHDRRAATDMGTAAAWGSAALSLLALLRLRDRPAFRSARSNSSAIAAGPGLAGLHLRQLAAHVSDALKALWGGQRRVAGVQCTFISQEVSAARRQLAAGVGPPLAALWRDLPGPRAR